MRIERLRGAKMVLQCTTIVFLLLENARACQLAITNAKIPSATVVSSLAIVDGNPAVAFVERNVSGVGILSYIRSNDADGIGWDEMSAVEWSDPSSLSFDVALAVIGFNPAMATLDLLLDNTIRVSYVRSSTKTGAEASDWRSKIEIAILKNFAYSRHIALVELSTAQKQPMVMFFGDMVNGALNSQLYVGRGDTSSGGNWDIQYISVNLATPTSHVTPPTFSLTILDGRPAFAFIMKDLHVYMLRSDDELGSVWQPSVSTPIYNNSNCVNPILLPLSGVGDYVVLTLAKSADADYEQEALSFVCRQSMPTCPSTTLNQRATVGSVTSLAGITFNAGPDLGDVLAYQYVYQTDQGDSVFLNTYMIDQFGDSFPRLVYAGANPSGLFGRFASLSVANKVNVIASWHGGLPYQQPVQLSAESLTFNSVLYNDSKVPTICGASPTTTLPLLSSIPVLSSSTETTEATVSSSTVAATTTTESTATMPPSSTTPAASTASTSTTTTESTASTEATTESTTSTEATTSTTTESTASSSTESTLSSEETSAAEPTTQTEPTSPFASAAVASTSTAAVPSAASSYSTATSLTISSTILVDTTAASTLLLFSSSSSSPAPAATSTIVDDTNMTPTFVAIGVIAALILIAAIVLCIWFAYRHDHLCNTPKHSASATSESRRSTASRASTYRRGEMSRHSTRGRGRRRSAAMQSSVAMSLTMSSPRASQRSSSRKSSVKARTDTTAYGWLPPFSSTYDVVRSELQSNYSLPSHVKSSVNGSNEYESALSPLDNPPPPVPIYDDVSTPL